VCVSGRSLVQRSHIECGMSEYDREASIMRRAWPIGGCWAIARNYRTELVYCNVGCFDRSSVSLKECLLQVWECVGVCGSVWECVGVCGSV